MTFSADVVIKELSSLIELVADGTQSKHLSGSQKMLGFGVSTNVSIRVGLLESLNQNYREPASKDPLVDVFDDSGCIKLVALIPGIKKEEIETNVRNGSIEVKIRKNNSLFYRNIPCDVKPDTIAVKSVTYNNSVLEIVFKKGDG